MTIHPLKLTEWRCRFFVTRWVWSVSYDGWWEFENKALSTFSVSENEAWFTLLIWRRIDDAGAASMTLSPEWGVTCTFLRLPAASVSDRLLIVRLAMHAVAPSGWYRKWLRNHTSAFDDTPKVCISSLGSNYLYKSNGWGRLAPQMMSC